MYMNKVVFIIPGFLDSSKNKEYQVIGKSFQKQGIRPIYVDIQWKRSTISENTQDFLSLFRTTSARHKYVLGFSFGAIIASLAAAEEKVDGLFLCSLSPYFAEDLPHLKGWWKVSIGTKRVEDFKNIRIKEIVPKIHAETYLFMGTKESPRVEKRVRETYDTLRSKKHLIVVNGAKHDFADKYYLQEVKRVIDSL